MSPPDYPGLDRRRRELVDAALRTDPALGEELAVITDLLAPDARLAFWDAFADGCAGGRPAAAVLPALERAASRLASPPRGQRGDRRG